MFVGDVDEETRAGLVDVVGPDIAIPDVAVKEPVSGIAVEAGLGGASIGVTLNGLVNPVAAGPAACVFEYGLSRAYGQQAACKSTVGEGDTPVAVESQRVTGLLPDTIYDYRLDATNVADGHTNTGEGPEDEGAFTTPGPGLDGESAADVAASSATLDASINPHNTSATYYFEYGPSSGYGSQSPAAPGAGAGSGEGIVQVSRHLQGLAANTVYHYRLVVLSEGVTFDGPDQTFTTQPAGAEFVLPDERAWEQVSPVDKHGAVLSQISEAGVVQAAASGGAVTYLATNPTEKEVKGYSEVVQVISTRTSDGWVSGDISLPHTYATGPPAAEGPEYRFFSSDLSEALVEPIGEFVSLAPEETPTALERTPYVRHGTNCTATPASGCFEPLVFPGDVPAGTKVNGTQDVHGDVNFVGASPDLGV